MVNVTLFGYDVILCGPFPRGDIGMSLSLEDLSGDSIRLEYQAGGVSPLKALHTTGWRVLPGLMLSQAYRGSERIFFEDGREETAKTGELIVLPSGIRHRVDVVGSREVRRWVHLNYFVLDSIDLFSLFDIPVLLERKLGKRIGDLIQEWTASEERGNGKVPLARAARRNEYGFRLLGLLAPACTSGTGLDGRLEDLQRFRPVIEHMRRNFSRPLTRDDLARLARLSSTQFHAAFRKAMGTTPVRFLRDIRLRNAQRLLITTTKKMSVIGTACGYEDQYVFSKFFRKACGVSPTEYRAATKDLRAAT